MVGFKWAAAAAVVAAASAAPSAPKKVPGKVFDRIAIVYFENTDFDKAIGDPNFAALAKEGITLTNYYGVTHPSEPNYVASIGGDNFGMDNDDLNKIPANVSTVIDLLEDKGITWGEYQENMPHTGYEGFEYLNQETQANMYVRKHNPAVIYNSVANKPDRLNKIKNLTLFDHDLRHDQLPQWMFITPNMTDDGHDSSVTVAGNWAKNFLGPLIKNPKFMEKTLMLITWDENETYTIKNNILGILIGDAVPENLKGTTDNTFYDHYSEAATVEANWDLHTLGRWDAGANVFKFVAEKTGDKQRAWSAITGDSPTVFLNQSYAGPYSDSNNSVPLPIPDVKAVVNGRTVLPKVVNTWGKAEGHMIYNTGVEIPDFMHPPKGY